MVGCYEGWVGFYEKDGVWKLTFYFIIIKLLVVYGFIRLNMMLEEKEI